MAVRLDELGIKWEREGLKIPFVLDSRSRTYHPDFYLPDFDTFIEVKGYWTEAARQKMAAVLEQNEIRLIYLESLKAIQEFLPKDHHPYRVIGGIGSCHGQRSETP